MDGEKELLGLLGREHRLLSVEDFKFAAAIASFGLILPDSPHRGQATLGAVLELANARLGTDAGGYRAEFVELVRRAQRVSQTPRR